MMNLQALMSRKPITVPPDSSLDGAMELMDEHQIRHLPVYDRREGVLGVLSDRDLLEATGWLHPDTRSPLDGPTGEARDFMSSPVIGVGKNDTIEQVLDTMVSHRIGCVPVLDGKRLLGVVTEMDVLSAYADACRSGAIVPDDEPTMHDLMTPCPFTISPDEDGIEAAGRLEEGGCRHLPVLENGVLVGVLSDRDVKRERGHGSLETTLVREMMSEGPATASSSDRLSKAALVLCAERISSLPIVDDGELVGIVSLVDILTPCAAALRKLA